MNRALLFAILLSGCATTPMQWVRHDATPAQAEADAQTCQQQAYQEARWMSWNYPGAFPGWWGPAWFGHPWRTPFGWSGGPNYGQILMEESRLAQFCMHSKGYQLLPVPQAK